MSMNIDKTDCYKEITPSFIDAVISAVKSVCDLYNIIDTVGEENVCRDAENLAISLDYRAKAVAISSSKESIEGSNSSNHWRLKENDTIYG